MLLQEVSDPRVLGASVTDVTVDRELAYAEVYISALEGSSRWPELRAGLESASGYLRRELAQRIELRVFPRLRFHWDPTFERAEHIEALFASLHTEEASAAQSEPHEDAEAEEEEDDHASG